MWHSDRGPPCLLFLIFSLIFSYKHWKQNLLSAVKMNLLNFSKRVLSKFWRTWFSTYNYMVFLAGVVVAIFIAPILISLIFGELYLGRILNLFRPQFIRTWWTWKLSQIRINVVDIVNIHHVLPKVCRKSQPWSFVYLGSFYSWFSSWDLFL